MQNVIIGIFQVPLYYPIQRFLIVYPELVAQKAEISPVVTKY